jgi:capsular polysaccharide biosynthesis protein
MEQENNNSSFIQTISIFDIFSLLISKCLWILLAGIIAATGIGLYTKLAIEPTYESYITMSVFNRALTDNNNVSSSEVTASEKLATTYTVILKSNTVLSAVIDDLKKDPKYADLDISLKDLKNYTQITTVNNTQILKITVTTTDPVLSADIANTFAKVSPEIMEVTFPVGGVKNLDGGEAKYSPVAPSLSKNCIIGFLLGALLLSAVYIIRMLLDTTIHEPEDMEKITKLPLLGTIPTMSISEDTKDFSWKLAEPKNISPEKN